MLYKITQGKSKVYNFKEEKFMKSENEDSYIDSFLEAKNVAEFLSDFYKQKISVKEVSNETV